MSRFRSRAEVIRAVEALVIMHSLQRYDPVFLQSIRQSLRQSPPHLVQFFYSLVATRVPDAIKVLLEIEEVDEE